MWNVLRLIAPVALALALSACNTGGIPGPSGKDAEAPIVPSLLIAPADPTACPAGGVAVTLGGNTQVVCNGQSGANGTPGQHGSDGQSITGPKGDTGAVGATGPQGDVGATGPGGARGTDGTNGHDGVDGSNGHDGANGQDAAPVTIVPLCPGAPTYPSVFVEIGLCLSNKLYGVYSANGGFLTELPPGAYSSNAIGSACNLTVGPNCQVTH